MTRAARVSVLAARGRRRHRPPHCRFMGTRHSSTRSRLEQNGADIMRKLLLVGLGLCTIGALWRAEQEEDGTIVALSPFLAALALEVGIFMLRRHQSQLLSAP